MKHLAILLTLLLLGASLSACGQKGDLYLPDDPAHKTKAGKKKTAQ